MSKQRPSLAHAIEELTEVALGARDPSIAWPAVMACLEQMIGFDSGFVATTMGTARESAGVMFGHDETLLRERIGPYLSRITPQEIASYSNRARPDHEIWSRRQRCALAEAYAPLHPDRAPHMLVRVGWRDGVLLGFNFERGLHSRPFDEGECRIVDALAPVIQIVSALGGKSADRDAYRNWASEWGLTKREIDIAELAMCGLQNPEIGSVLRLSRHTVRNTLANVFVKAEASTRAELSFLAHRPLPQPLRHPSVACPMPTVDGVTRFFERVRVVTAAAPPRLVRPEPSQSKLPFSYASPLPTPTSPRPLR